jgi:hypothetical protein
LFDGFISIALTTSVSSESRTFFFHLSTSRVPAIRKDSLTSDPRAISAKESNHWCNVLDHGQSVSHAIALVEFDRFGRFLGIEKRYFESALVTFILDNDLA